MDIIENLLVIGNGFDLDLGLPTKFSDFAKSEYWPKAKKIDDPIKFPTRTAHGGFNAITPIYPTVLLEHYLEDKLDKELWFDLEKCLLDYASPNVSKEIVDPSQEDESDIKKNIAYYDMVRDALGQYIADVQNSHPINSNSVAGKTLQTIIKNGFFRHICSFNYTNLNRIAKQLGISKEINYYHIHGSVADNNNSIILGVHEAELREGYDRFRKTQSEYYTFHNLYTELDNANEIVFFGLSFGEIDYSYFNLFFKNLVSSSHYAEAEKDKKRITIFTKDNDSRHAVLSSLRKMGIDVQRLFAQSIFQIICTAEGLDGNVFCDFCKRLNENGFKRFGGKKEQ